MRTFATEVWDLSIAWPFNLKQRLDVFFIIVSSMVANPEHVIDDIVVAQAAAPRLIPIDPHRSSEAAANKWIRSCIQSPSGASFIYAAIATFLRAAHQDPEACKWRAIAEVNKLLSDSPDDVTMATVLILFAIEEADLSDATPNGDEQQYRASVNDAHRNGLRTMIKQRGGLAALRDNRCLQVYLLM
jgi:hypothetical protein